jgi:predicted component of type VI protein secretion system
MPAQLFALNDGPSIWVDKPILLVGRHPECDVQIDSRKVSRRHCCIAQVHDYLVVRDLGSTNGVRINGARVLEGRLRAGDELTIGSHRYQISWDSVAPAAPRGRARETLRAAEALPPAEDSMLESFDEPVALPDPHNRVGRQAPAGDEPSLELPKGPQ